MCKLNFEYRNYDLIAVTTDVRDLETRANRVQKSSHMLGKRERGLEPGKYRISEGKSAPLIYTTRKSN